MHAVLDTNVLVSALKSKKGASHQVLRAIRDGRIRIAVSVPLVVEYESVLLRPGMIPTYAPAEIGRIIDALTSLAWHQAVYFLWRPWLSDPKDEMVLEVALAAQMNYIISHNVADFAAARQTGVKAITPQEALNLI